MNYEIVILKEILIIKVFICKLWRRHVVYILVDLVYSSPPDSSTGI